MQIAVRISEGFATIEERLRGQEGVTLVRCDDDAALLAALPRCAALVVGGYHYNAALAQALREGGHGVRWIQFASAGVDSAVRHGVPPGIAVTNAAPAFAPTVAEHAMALILAALRRIVEIDRERAVVHPRQRYLPRLASAEDATLVLLGFGGVGRAVVTRALAFGMRPVVVTRRPHEVDAPGCEAHALSRLREVLPRADVLLVAVALTDATRGLVNAEALARLPRHAWVVNVARGGVIDEPALIAALSARAIAGAALDVTEREPAPADSALRTLDNVILTPHVAGFGSASARTRLADIVQHNVRRFVAGEPLQQVVVRTVLDAGIAT